MNGESLPPDLGNYQPPHGTPPGLPSNRKPATSSGMAVTSLVLGILSLICFGILTGIPAIIFGHIAHGRARKSPERFGGAGMAIAGFIMGYLSIFVTILVAAMLLPALVKAKGKAQEVHCVSQMKQVGLAAQIWAGDNNDLFPFNVSTNKGGTLEYCQPDNDGYDANALRHFQVLAGELGSPTILVCRADRSKIAAADFQNLQPANVSYLLRTGTNISFSHPGEILVRCPIHENILRCDGSVIRGDKK